jgi:hypothetical protein
MPPRHIAEGSPPFGEADFHRFDFGSEERRLQCYRTRHQTTEPRRQFSRSSPRSPCSLDGLERNLRRRVCVYR